MEDYKIESIKKLIKEKLADETKFHKDEYYQGRVSAFQFCLDLLADTDLVRIQSKNVLKKEK